MRIGAVQHRHFAPCAALLHPLADPIHDEVRLVALVERGVQLDALAVLTAGPQRLAEPAGVVGDERVGRFQYRAGGAVVLLQLVEHRLRIIAAKLMQILDSRAAPTIDGLIVVADGEGKARGAREQREPFVLDGIGVLEFVHQDMPKAGAVMLQERAIVAPQLIGAQQQFRKIHDAGALARLLVGLIDLDQLAARRIAVVLDVLGAHGPRPSGR